MNPFEDKDGVGVARFPVRLREYRPDALPSASKFVGCVITINDPADGNPRPKLALSNGASWDIIGDVSVPAIVAAPAPAPVIVAQPVVGPVDTPAVDQLRAELAATRSDQAAMAATMTEMAHAINTLQRINHEHEQRLADLERTSIREGDVVDRRKLLGEAA